MKKTRIVFCISILLTLNLAREGYGQSETELTENSLSINKTVITNSLMELENEAKKLDSPLAQAVAFAEIADAGWDLDKGWAQSLLLEAYKLTYPSSAEREQLEGLSTENTKRNSSAKKIDRDRERVRRRIVAIATRDAKFAATLAQSIGRDLGKTSESRVNVTYANQMTKTGDVKAASDYILRAIEAEPTQVWNGYAIYALAEKDRKAADALILQYIKRVEIYPLSASSLLYVFDSFDAAVFADRVFDPENRQVRPSSPEVIKAYLNFALNKMIALEQSQLGSLREIGGTLQRFWQRVNMYAPELRPSFLQLSQAAGQDAKLSDTPVEELQRKNEENLLERADKTREADDLERAVKVAIWRKDFEKARKLADSFKIDETKAKFTEEINVEEALSLIESKDIFEAERVASKLNKPNNISKVYSSLIRSSVSSKNKQYARSLAYEVVRRLKKFNDSIHTPYLISELVLSTASVDATLAFELLDEMVQSLNRRRIDSENGDIGFNPIAFAKLTFMDEQRTQQTARNITDRLQRIMALSSIYRWKANELTRSEKSKATQTKQATP